MRPSRLWLCAVRAEACLQEAEECTFKPKITAKAERIRAKIVHARKPPSNRYRLNEACAACLHRIKPRTMKTAHLFLLQLLAIAAVRAACGSTWIGVSRRVPRGSRTG